MSILSTPDGRRAAAFGAMLGGGFVMTGYAVAALYLVRTNAAYVFYLGLAAHLAILIVLTGFIAQLVRRSIKGSFGAASFEATDSGDATTVTTTTEVRP